MISSEVLRTGLLPGAVAGLLGGLAFGATMADLDLLPTYSEIVYADSSVVGFIVILVAGALIGAGFGLLVWHQRPGVGETLFWGLVYAIFWWYLGPLTLKPLVQGDSLTWDVKSVQVAFPMLLGHVVYGACTGLALVGLQLRRHLEGKTSRVTLGAVVRGALAGVAAASLLGAALNSQGELLGFAPGLTEDSYSAAWGVILGIGVAAGVCFALLYPNPADGAGSGFVRGTVYGFLWWVVGVLTLVPLFSGVGLAWSIEEVREVFVTLPGYLLFGSGVALVYQCLGAMVRLLFSQVDPIIRTAVRLK